MFWLQKDGEDEGLHIKILRGALHYEVFTVEEISRRLDLNQEQTAFLTQELHHTAPFFKYVGSSEQGSKYMLSLEGRSRLLEYDELKEARKNARDAQLYASLALIVSVIGVLVQIFC